MKVNIFQPVGFTEVGGRTNNEDSIYPAISAVTANQRLFLVCDGVGGQHKGEVASALACTSMAHYFQQNPVEVSDEQYIQSALQYTIDAFVQLEREDAETAGMATTLTLLHFNEAGATIAHLGDSRIYQVREGVIIRVSEDHKLVNELVRDGHITSEQALSHSQRNVITKVISADRQDAPDVKIINDVQAGDYFFLCTDGVLEQIYDDLLTYHLRSSPDNELNDVEKLENIRLECVGKTRDNFSAYLVQVESVTGTVKPQYQIDLPIIHAVAEAPIAMPIQTGNGTIQYEADAPTEYTRPVVRTIQPSEIYTVPELPAPKETKHTSKKKLNLVQLAIGIVIGIAAAGGGVWYWVNNKPPLKKEISTIPAVSTPLRQVTSLLPPAQLTTKKKPKNSSARPDSPHTGTIIFGNKEFSITKEGKQYFCRDKKTGKKTLVIYDDDIDNFDGIAYRYSFGSKSRIYLVQPNKIITQIDSSKLEKNEIIYHRNGMEYRIDPKTGKERHPIKALQEEQKN